MPAAPYAKIRVSLNGGAVQTGGITASGGQTCQLSAEPAGLAGATQVLWEILDRPTGFALPAGWSLASDGRTCRYIGATPPVFTLASVANWGKYIFRLTLNGGGPTLTGRETAAQREAIAALVDESTGVSVPSVDGLLDLGAFEKSQFGGTLGWVKDWKTTLRLIQTLITSAGGGSGTNNHSALSNLLIDSHTQYLLASGARALAGILNLGGFRISNVGTPTNATDAATKAYVDSTSGFSPAGTPAAGDVVKFDGTVPRWGGSDAYAITSFAASTPVLEVGATATTPAFTAAHNRTPSALTLTNTDNAESKSVVATPTGFTSSQSYTKTGNNASVSFTITGSDGISPANRSAAIAWRPRVYWGVAAAGLNSEAGIEGLASSELLPSRVKTFGVNATGSTKIYFACPASYGTPTFTVGGFSGGFNLVSASINVTNAFGVTQAYQLWESSTPGLGATTVAVT
jgi:hypothetical protein